MGAWIEISLLTILLSRVLCRTPRWVRGLKLPHMFLTALSLASHPTMGAWIEIA